MSIANINNINLTPKLAYAHYKCNDDAGSTVVTDDGTGANNGTGNVNTSNYSVVGKINDAFEFNGSSEYIDCDTLWSDISSDTTGSVAFWVYPTSGSNYMFAIGDTNGNEHLYMGYSTSGYAQIFSKVAGTDLMRVTTPSASMATGNWYHLAFVQNGTEIKIYINGVSQELTWITDTDKGLWFSDQVNSDTLSLGAIRYNSGTSLYANGKLDDFRYYQNKALTLAEVGAIYNGGTGTENELPSVSKISTKAIASISKIMNVTK